MQTSYGYNSGIPDLLTVTNCFFFGISIRLGADTQWLRGDNCAKDAKFDKKKAAIVYTFRRVLQKLVLLLGGASCIC